MPLRLLDLLAPLRLLDLLAPPGCAVCFAPVAAGPLCAACRAAIPWLRDPCPRCALPRPCARRAGAPCPAADAAFAAAWAPVAYAGPARDLVLALKLRGALAAADAMAAQIAAGAPPALLDGATLVPVPPARGRRRRRGFDPAATLAAALARRTGRPVVSCLVRRSGRRRQAGLGRRARLAALEDAIGVAPACAPPARAVLVDDVHTTGATLGACARALRIAGSPHVVAVTYGRTLGTS